MKQLPDHMMRQFWQDSAKEAPEGFSDFIMQHLPQQVPLPDELKKPLLSPWAIASLAVLLVVVGYLISLSGGKSATLPAWSLALQNSVTDGLGWLANSPTTLAIVAVCVLFLVGLDTILQRFMQRTQ